MSSAPPRPRSGVEGVLEAGGPWLREGLVGVERRLREVLSGHGGALSQAATATVAAGGKRLRPMLVLIAAAPDELGRRGAPARPPETVLRAAAAVELVHSATLVHDDILDGASVRRGRPTVAASLGRDMAVATGDLLFARAFAELADNGSEAQLRVLSQASSDLARGELLQREDAWSDEVSVERYLLRCELKTASLFEAACRLGSLARGGTGEPDGALEALAGFGQRVGLAFQLLDDVLDVTGPPERTGKPRGADLLDGTVTLPLILARERDPDLARLGLRSLNAAGAIRVCERIEASGALERTRQLALDLVAAGRQRLVGLSGLGRRPLLDLVAGGVVDRYT